MNKLFIPFIIVLLATSAYAMDFLNPVNPINPFNPLNPNGLFAKNNSNTQSSCQAPEKLNLQQKKNLVLDIVKFKHDVSKKYLLKLYICSDWLCGESLFQFPLDPSQSDFEGSRITLMSTYTLGCIFSRNPNDNLSRFVVKVEEVTGAFSFNKSVGKNSVFIADLAAGPMKVILDGQQKIETRMEFE